MFFVFHRNLHLMAGCVKYLKRTIGDGYLFRDNMGIQIFDVLCQVVCSCDGGVKN